MSLYTKYRPKDWDSVVGQDAISQILRSSLIQNKIGHAYILTGSRGTGKTTTARIMAKWVNCLDLHDGNPCHKCAHCVAFDAGNMLDCIEIDGASNNGVENVRDLIEKARFEPNQGKYKIYIIDEVHMLSTGAFNALLKTLEEPPAHVIFILATTEIEKVPETIRSRSLRFDFKKISEIDIIKRLEFVCKEEGIKAEKEALAIIAKAARGGLRDALTLTEQNTVNNEINTEYVRSTLSLIEDSLISEIISAIINQDIWGMTQILNTLRERHAEVRWLFDQILYWIRDRMMDAFLWKSTETSFAEYSEIFAIFESAYSRIKTISDGWLLIEITLMRAVKRGEKITNKGTEMGKSESILTGWQTNKETKEKTVWVAPSSVWEFWGSISEDSRKKSQTVWAKASFWDWENQTENRSQNESEEVKTFGTFSHKSTEIIPSEEKTPQNPTFSYIRFLEEIKKVKSSLVLDLKTARFELKEKNLILLFAKEWHFNRTNDTSMKNIIIETLENLYGTGWSLDCRLDARANPIILDEVF